MRDGNSAPGPMFLLEVVKGGNNSTYRRNRMVLAGRLPIPSSLQTKLLNFSFKNSPGFSDRWTIEADTEFR
jgi:hypothetical protein